jgi:hypothetical protein
MAYAGCAHARDSSSLARRWECGVARSPWRLEKDLEIMDSHIREVVDAGGMATSDIGRVIRLDELDWGWTTLEMG